eukprot:2151924-Prymnesium_polylepis.1
MTDAWRTHGSPLDILSALGFAECKDEQLTVLQQSWLTADTAAMSLSEATEILGRLGKATSLEGQLEVLKVTDNERRVVAALDNAVAPLFMQRP